MQGLVSTIVADLANAMLHQRNKERYRKKERKRKRRKEGMERGREKGREKYLFKTNHNYTKTLRLPSDLD